MFDDDEDVLALSGQGDGLDEVAGEQCVGLGAQEVGPGGCPSFRGWVDAFGFGDFPDGGGGGPDAEDGEFAVDASVAPRRVLADQAQDQDADGVRGAWPAGAFGSRGVRLRRLGRVLEGLQTRVGEDGVEGVGELSTVIEVRP
ncbi:hypothetical protein ABH925_005182 [Streptacidiphilus sp. EB129]